VRCPYLFESEEFRLFIRPHLALSQALTLLPKLNGEQLLERISRYYSFTGEITETKLQRQMTHILAFIKAARHMHAQLEKFREVIARMEGVMEVTQATQKEINEMLYKYEEQGLKAYTKDEKQLDKYTLFKHP